MKPRLGLASRSTDRATLRDMSRPLKLSLLTGVLVTIVAIVSSLALVRLADGIEDTEHDLADLSGLQFAVSNAALFTQRYGVSAGIQQDDRRVAEQSWGDAERARSALLLRASDDRQVSELLTRLDVALAAERLTMDRIWSSIDRGDAVAARAIALDQMTAEQFTEQRRLLSELQHAKADALRDARELERNWLFGLLAMFTSGVLLAVGSVWITWRRATSSARHSAVINHRLRKLAMRDPLTRLANRRHLDEDFGRAAAFAERTGEELFVAVIDLDRFKEINDRFGHHAGDHVLVEVARRLRAECRDIDTVARCGGDEFIVVIQSADRTSQPGLAGALRAAVNRPTVFEGQSIAISASIGVARYPSEGNTLDKLCDEADRAMYRDKAKNRDASGIFSTLETTAFER